MILTAIGIFFNVDRRFQTFILNTFPKYGIGLTKFEDNEAVKKQLQDMNQKPVDQTKIGKPTSDMTLKGPIAPELIPGGIWFNSDPLSLEQLKGKVVIVDFWTYSCINCQRTMPYLRKWWEAYNNKGLVIIGVHSPEFEFEKSEKNLAQAIKDFKLPYPIMQDNDFATWKPTTTITGRLNILSIKRAIFVILTLEKVDMTKQRKSSKTYSKKPEPKT